MTNRRLLPLLLPLLTGCANFPVIAQNEVPAGVTYVWWDFGVAELEEIQFDFSIPSSHGNSPGIYFQFYQGHIGENGFYFGLQTDVNDPARPGGSGKGILFSRWGTRDTENLRPTPGGWIESSGHEGDFVGVRAPYNWGTDRYRIRLEPVDYDASGVWYGLFLENLDRGGESYAGAIRFEKENGQYPKIKNGGGSWTEIYHGVTEVQNVPETQFVLDAAFANYRTVVPRRATSDYSAYRNSDVSYDRGRVTMRFGPSVTRSRPAGQLFVR